MKQYLSTKNLAVGYRGKAVVSGIEIGLRRGQILTLIGPNGAGKSTLLKSIARQLAPVKGAVYLDGAPMGALSERALAKKLSLVLTERIAPELMTCEDVVATGRYPYTGRLGILSEEDKEVVRQSLALVHAEALARCDFLHISDGQRQRVLLARALCQQPEVIVLDEPTSFLDLRHKLELLTILKRMVREKQLAVVVSLHEVDLAQKLSDVVVCVHNGAVEKCGTPEEVFTEDYISRLYGIKTGSYNAAFGCLELAAPEGAPAVFVIGGGGSGIPLYRRLQREGTPFAAGVLHRSDLDYPVAKALAAQVIDEAPYAAIAPETVQRALRVLESCERVFCCVPQFGALNEGNRALRARAEELGLLET